MLVAFKSTQCVKYDNLVRQIFHFQNSIKKNTTRKSYKTKNIIMSWVLKNLEGASTQDSMSPGMNRDGDVTAQ